jgi:hypothetical protein
VGEGTLGLSYMHPCAREEVVAGRDGDRPAVYPGILLGFDPRHPICMATLLQCQDPTGRSQASAPVICARFWPIWDLQRANLKAAEALNQHDRLMTGVNLGSVLTLRSAWTPRVSQPLLLRDGANLFSLRLGFIEVSRWVTVGFKGGFITCSTEKIGATSNLKLEVLY